MLRLGIIGSGGMARTRCANIAAMHDAQLVAIASRNPVTGGELARATSCAYEAGAESLVARTDLDAVLICTHNASHGALATAALAAGKHVLVEYPLALAAAEARAAVTMATERGLALRVGYDQQWLGPHAAIGAMVGEAGLPLAAYVQVSAAAPAKSSFRSLAIGGAPGQVKPYYLYALLDWLGLPASSVNRSLVHVEGTEGRYSAGTQMVELSYPGTLAQLAWVVGAGVQGRQQIRIALHWAGHSLHTDGREIAVIDVAGERTLPVERLPWAEATRLGMERFAADCMAVVPPLEQALLATEAARILDPGAQGARIA